MFFQFQNLPINEDIEEDESFFETKKYIEKISGNEIPDETFKKILNNWYIWANNNIKVSENINLTPKFSNPIQWLITNKFRIDYKIFEENATEEAIEKFRKIMTEDSEEYVKLKEMAQNEYKNVDFTYEKLLKIIAGFAENFSTKL